MMARARSFRALPSFLWMVNSKGRSARTLDKTRSRHFLVILTTLELVSMTRASSGVAASGSR